MEIKIVSSKEVFDKKKNPTLCLSALRGTDQCHLCDKIAKEIIGTPIDLILKNLQCKPHITKENKTILKEYDVLLAEREVLTDKIDLIRKRLGLKQE